MRFPSDLLVKLARANGNAEFDGLDQTITITPDISLVLPLRGPLRRNQGFTNTDIQRESFYVSRRIIMPASTAEKIEAVCTFGRGLWHVRGRLSQHSDFTRAPAAAAPGTDFASLQAPDGLDDVVLKTYAIANSPQSVDGEWIWLLVDDSWLLEMTVGVTGVGQLQEMTLAVLASRLL